MRILRQYSSDKAKERRDEEVVVALRGISKTLNQLVKRVESTETEVKKVKGRLKGVSNSSSIGETPTQVSVPLFVRVSEGIRLLKKVGVKCGSELYPNIL